MRRILCVLRRIGVLAACLLMISAAAAERPFAPLNETDAAKRALDLFCECAFHPEYGDEDAARLTRWEQEITVWIGGSATQEDLRTADRFLEELNTRVEGFPGIRRVRRDTDAAVRIWFVPEYLLGSYIEGYVQGNMGFFHFNEDRSFRIVSARIGIASDSTEQEERNHLLQEELVGALGLPGDHTRYTDSILYDGWTTVQTLCDADWRMLNMLYRPELAPGQTEEQARETLKGVYGLRD